MAVVVSGVQKTTRASRCRTMKGAALRLRISQSERGFASMPGTNTARGRPVPPVRGASSADRLFESEDEKGLGSRDIEDASSAGVERKGEHRDQRAGAGLPRGACGRLALRMALC